MCLVEEAWAVAPAEEASSANMRYLCVIAGISCNLSSFRRFVRLCAGRVGQLANLSALGADAGVSHTTASHWLTVLEASYIVFRLPPFFANIRKQLVKSPKLYFYDVGLKR